MDVDALRLRVEAQEAVVREHHADYDDKLARAGIWQALQKRPDGSYVDTMFARLIYGDSNPPAKAYELAEAILAGHHAPPTLSSPRTSQDLEAMIVSALADAIRVAMHTTTVTVTQEHMGRFRRAWRALISG